VEQLGAELDRGHRTTQPLEQPQQATDDRAALFGDTPCWTLERRSWRWQPSVVRGFGGEGAEPYEQTRGARTRVGDDRTMSVQQSQIEHPAVEPSDPLDHALPGHAVSARDGLERHPVVDLGHRAQHVGHAVDLARQGVTRQHALACSAVPTPGQPDVDVLVPRLGLQASVDLAPGQLERASPAARADPLDRHRKGISSQRFCIPGRVDAEYVHHTYLGRLRGGRAVDRCGQEGVVGRAGEGQCGRRK